MWKSAMLAVTPYDVSVLFFYFMQTPLLNRVSSMIEKCGGCSCSLDLLLCLSVYHFVAMRCKHTFRRKAPAEPPPV